MSTLNRTVNELATAFPDDVIDEFSGRVLIPKKIETSLTKEANDVLTEFDFSVMAMLLMEVFVLFVRSNPTH